VQELINFATEAPNEDTGGVGGSELDDQEEGEKCDFRSFQSTFVDFLIGEHLFDCFSKRPCCRRRATMMTARQRCDNYFRDMPLANYVDRRFILSCRK
jgi:hypothetical protein